MSGVSYKWGKTQISFLEGLMARGDRRISSLIINAYENGCRLDGWNEYFNLETWEKAIAEERIDPVLFSHRTRHKDEPLPWDHIDSRISKSFLIEEWDKSVQGNLTPDCREGKCSMCGICDFETVKPHIEDKIIYERTGKIAEPQTDHHFKRIKCSYEKTGDARFFGHLELVNLFSKALRRTGIAVKYTSGYHKIIKIVFSNPLPVGYESLDEFFIIEVHEDFDTNRIMTELGPQIPVGLKLTGVVAITSKKEIQENPNKRFSVSIRNYVFSQSYIDVFENESFVLFEKVNKKGDIKSLNLKEFIQSITIEENDRISFDMISAGGIHIRPEDAIKQIFSISQVEIKKADIIKLRHFG
jgi:radical SAM-linked protein